MPPAHHACDAGEHASFPTVRGGVLLRQDFCARRLADASLSNLSTDGIANDFCDNRLKRRGTIANGKLEGTAIAAYWNLERAPKQ